MIGRIVTPRWRAMLAVAALTWVSAAEAAAYGNPTYVVYVDGPNGGTIEASNGALPLPDGACGMRLTNSMILSWSWYSGDVWPIEVLAVENNGWMPPPNQLTYLIEFTGPFGSGCDGDHVFHTPATPTSEPPPGAVALVVQFVDPAQVEFLNHAFQTFEPPDPPGPGEPPPTLEDICEDVPEFCEIPGSFVEDPCNQSDWSWLCDDAEDTGRFGFGARLIVDPKALGLAALRGAASDGPVLRQALTRLAKALALEPAATAALSELIARRSGIATTYPARALSRVAVGTHLAYLGLERCRGEIVEALRLVPTGTTTRDPRPLLARERQARTICDSAAQSLAGVGETSVLFTIGLRNER
jgi:hypothetical protein